MTDHFHTRANLPHKATSDQHHLNNNSERRWNSNNPRPGSITTPLPTPQRQTDTEGQPVEDDDEEAPMGVYDHMMRPSMGHKMQVELRDSMNHYNKNKAQLHQQLNELRFDQRDLYTSPIPPSPTPSVKTWSQDGSRFSSAPEKAAQKARLAKLEQENTALTLEAQAREAEARNTTLLPPIKGKDQEAEKKGSSSKKAKEAGQGKSNSKKGGSSKGKPSEEDQKATDEAEKKSLRFGADVELKTPMDNKQSKKGGKGKTAKGNAPQAGKSVLKDKPLYSIKLPTIHSANAKRTMWDSGHNHIHRKGKSISLEKSTVEEEWRQFSHRSVDIPDIADSKRTEIKLPLVPKPPPNFLPKVKFTGRQPKPPQQPQRLEPSDSLIVTQSTPFHDVHPSKRNQVFDHFPQRRESQKVPGLDDTVSDVTDLDDEEDDMDRLRLPSLPVVRLSEEKLSQHNFQNTRQMVPRLRLESPLSTVTGRSGATGATYMSQETLEWKGEYMRSGDPCYKNRMLAEILHVVRQRMHDNEQDLRMSGDDPRPGDSWRGEPQLDIMLLEDRGDHSSCSGDTTERSLAERTQNLLNAPRHRQKVAPLGRTTKQRQQGLKLRSYLNKLSHKRKAVEQRQRERVRFQLSQMTIKEMTQDSIGRHSTAHTATTSAA